MYSFSSRARRPFLLIISCCIVSHTVLSQSRSFLTRDNVKTDSSRSYFFRDVRRSVVILSPADKPKETFEVKIDSIAEYFTATGKLKQRFFTMNGLRQGNYTEYYESGRIKTKRAYKDGFVIGYSSSWYPSGRLKATLQFEDTLRRFPHIINFWDSTGVQIVKDGNGYCGCVGLVEDSLIEEGKVINGLRDSVWQGTFDNKPAYRRVYRDGALVESQQEQRLHDLVFTAVEQQPMFPGGPERMMEFVKKNLHYPAEARRMRMEAIVMVEFVVNRDGTLTEIKAVKDMGRGTAQEAERIVKLMPKWVPGSQSGIPVRVRFIIPIHFRLPGS